MPKYLLAHQHHAKSCAQVFAAWQGLDSNLRHRTALSTCPYGGHSIWWVVTATDEGDALALLPEFVARTTSVARVDDVPIP